MTLLGQRQMRHFFEKRFQPFFSFATSYLHTHFPKYWLSGYWVISANRTNGRTDRRRWLYWSFLSYNGGPIMTLKWFCENASTPSCILENMTKNAFLGILGTSFFIFFGLWNQKLKYLIFSSFKSIICCTKYLINSES